MGGFYDFALVIPPPEWVVVALWKFFAKNVGQNRAKFVIFVMQIISLVNLPYVVAAIVTLYSYLIYFI